MKKTLIILVTVALLGILAAAVKPSPLQKTTASTTGSSTAATTPSSAPASTATVPATSSNSATAPATNTATSGQYKDGTYTGNTATNFYDEIKVAIVVSGGKITSITTPTLNGDSGHSTQINNYAVPQLTQQALSAQSSSLDGVSGATYTTEAYVSSLQSAIDQAKA